MNGMAEKNTTFKASTAHINCLQSYCLFDLCFPTWKTKNVPLPLNSSSGLQCQINNNFKILYTILLVCILPPAQAQQVHQNKES